MKTEQIKELNENEVFELYHAWSEQFYAASFLSPDKEAVKRFRAWLRKINSPRERRGEDYEIKFIEEFRRQENSYRSCWCFKCECPDPSSRCECQHCEDLENGKSEILCCQCHFSTGEKRNESDS